MAEDTFVLFSPTEITIPFVCKMIIILTVFYYAESVLQNIRPNFRRVYFFPFILNDKKSLHINISEMTLSFNIYIYIITICLREFNILLKKLLEMFSFRVVMNISYQYFITNPIIEKEKEG